MADDMNLIGAINHALRNELQNNERLRILGYDIGPVGGMFRATERLFEDFGEDRIIDTPLTENGLMGMAVGMAIAGDRPVLEMQFLGFMYNAWGQLVYHLSNLHQNPGLRQTDVAWSDQERA